MTEQSVTIPYAPRKLQAELHEDSHRFKVPVCHRRFGKTVWAVNEILRKWPECHLEMPRYAYIAPQLNQAKKISWDYFKKFAGAIPGTRFNESELKCDLPGGGRIYVLGADYPDSLRGPYWDGVVFDEYAQMHPRAWGEVIRPALADRKGWAVFLGTPMGHNQFYELHERAKNDPDWFTRVYRASETGYVDPSELKSAAADMTPEQYAQEFECSWSAAIIGSYYGRLLEDADREGRIATFQPDPNARVVTAWDLGVGDSTAIWFAQMVGREPRVIDYYESNGEPLSHYASVLDKKGYLYSAHILPHDCEARELGTGKTRRQIAEELGVRPVKVIKAQSVDNGIEHARRFLKQCVFRREACKEGLEALKQYRSEYDDKHRTFKDRPIHDWTSHAADAFRYLAAGWEGTAGAQDVNLSTLNQHRPLDAGLGY